MASVLCVDKRVVGQLEELDVDATKCAVGQLSMFPELRLGGTRVRIRLVGEESHQETARSATTTSDVITYNSGQDKTSTPARKRERERD